MSKDFTGTDFVHRCARPAAPLKVLSTWWPEGEGPVAYWKLVPCTLLWKHEGDCEFHAGQAEGWGHATAVKREIYESWTSLASTSGG